jgi:hypothetical protein
VLGLVRGEAKWKKLELDNGTLLSAKEKGSAEMLMALQVASSGAARDIRWLGTERHGTEWRAHWAKWVLQEDDKRAPLRFPFSHGFFGGIKIHHFEK